MSVTAECLAQAQYAPTGVTSIFSTGGTAIIDKFTVSNVTGSAATLDVFIVPNGLTSGTQYQLIRSLSVASNQIVDITALQNQILNTGDQLMVDASVANALVVRASGRVIT